MNVANLELCKALYEVSGWSDTEKNHYQPLKGDNNGNFKRDWVPDYDLGYLLRKLTAEYGKISFTNDYGNKMWWCTDGQTRKLAIAKTPEDAAAKLCIELFKQKILTKEKN